MGKVLNKEEEKTLAEALLKPKNESAIQIAFLFMELTMINSFVNQIDKTTTKSQIRHFYRETKTYLTERISGFVEVYKNQKDNFIEEDGDWEQYQEYIKNYVASLEKAKSINNYTVILQNMWTSLFPIIDGFVRICSNKINLVIGNNKPKA